MPDLSHGYLGHGGGNTAVVQAILGHAPLSLRMPGELLGNELFARNFMPYAKAHWNYDGSFCNCEDLSRALWATWDYAGFQRQALGGLPELPRADVVSCLGLTTGGIITRATAVFHGPARGNVRTAGTGVLDGRCLFPIHYVCRIGMLYFDPTFDRSTAFPADIVVRKLTKLGPAFWLSHDETWLYVRNTLAAPGFGDSWDELSAATWITSGEWTSRTARTGHWRSGELENVDKALLAFEKGRGGAAFEPLRAAFQNWFARNPKESTLRNAGNCVYRLALNLKLAKALLRG